MELPSRWQHKVWDPTENSALIIQVSEWQMETWKLKTRAEVQLLELFGAELRDDI